MNISILEKFKKTTALALAGIIVFSTISPAMTFAAVAVNNGDFSDLGGLTSDGDWNHGVPNSWTTLGGTNYIVFTPGTRLNLDHAGTISQSLGAVEAGGEKITVSFEYGDLWNDGYYSAGEDMITAELWDTTSNNSIASTTVKNTGAYGSLVSASFSNTTQATVGNDIELRFTGLAGTGIASGMAAALDNVSVSVSDGVGPVISEVAPVSTPSTDTTPDYTFTTDEEGTITYGGACTSTAFPAATSGSNTITFDTLAEGTYSDCTLTVTDLSSNVSNVIAVTPFTIDTSVAAPTVVSPANNSYTTSDGIDKVDWTDVVDAASPVTYVYSVSNSDATNPDGTFVAPLYTSGALTDSEIPTPGTPEWVYYFSIQATDALGNTSVWTTPSKVTVDNSLVISTVVVRGDTAAGENMPGWMFNRDTSTSTPYEFVTSTPSIGAGSLYVEPIGSTPANKFVGEYFFDTAAVKLADIQSVSYDFQIGSGGEAADANQFYMNVYANFGASPANKYYDCRYNVVPTSGAVGSYTTTTFDPTATYPVTQHGTSPFPCPASPAAMGVDAVVRAAVINLGDSTASDAGIDGFFDKVVVRTTGAITTYDFEDFVRTETSSNITVTPIALNGWTPTGTGGGSYEFIESAGAPTGNGSIQLITNADNNARAGASLEKNVPLADLHELSYKTRQNEGIPEADAAYRISFDADGDLSTTGDTATLIFEPYWQNGGVGDAAPVVPDVWQTWDVDNGLFWASISGANQPNLPALTNGAGGPPFYTLDQINALYPNAQTTRVSFGIGSYNPSWDIEVDDFVFSTKTNTEINTTTYNFEPVAVPACDAGDTTFDTFAYGSVNGQFGWSSTGPFDQEVVKNDYGITTFGCKSLRISNAVTQGSFGDQTFSYSTADEAGETIAENNGLSGGTRQNRFEAEFDIASTQSTEQTGLSLSVSPDRGDGARMSYLRFEDKATGIEVYFDDVTSTTGPATWNETLIATLDRSAPHTVKFSMDFVDGPSNDVVTISIDGVPVHTGTSWENYYRFDPESNPSLADTSRTVDSLLFRASSTAVPANAGNGFLFDNVELSTGASPDTTAPTVTINQSTTQVDPATSITIAFTAEFSEAVQPATFDCSDVSVTNGTCTSVTETSSTVYEITVEGIASGSVSATINAGGVLDIAGNANTASTSTDNTVTLDTSTPPTPPSGGGGGGSVIVPQQPNNNTPETPEDDDDTDTDTNDNEADDALEGLTPTQPTTPTTPPANNPNTGGTTGGTTGGGTTTGGTIFNPADATLDAGGGAPGDDETVTEEEPLNTTEGTVDIGGWAAPEDDSNMLTWILLALIAALNIWWFYAARSRRRTQ